MQTPKMLRKQRVTMASLPAGVMRRLPAGRTCWINDDTVTGCKVLYSRINIRTALVHSIARGPTNTLLCRLCFAWFRTLSDKSICAKQIAHCYHILIAVTTAAVNLFVSASHSHYHLALSSSVSYA